MFISLALVIVCFAGAAVPNNVISPCRIKDSNCIERSINAAKDTILSGDTKLGVPSSDPMFVDRIEGNISILKFNFFNCTVHGFRSCSVSNVKLDDDGTNILRLRYDMTCVKVWSTCTYDISGRLIIIPVEGSGASKINLGKYIVKVDSDVNKVEEDGKTHLAISKFRLEALPQESIKFDFKNLFNGHQELSDAVHKFAHENWREIADLLQDPLWYACMKEMINNVNKYMKQIPMEDMILN